MMKKNGFTLAEVLITLAIIGVVATLTLPALMTNTAEQQAVSAFKKGINTLTEAAQMNSAIEGFDYAGTSEDSEKDKVRDASGNPTQSVWGILNARASVDVNKSGLKAPFSIGGQAANSTSNFTVFFRDGSCLSFNYKENGNTTSAKTILGDGLPYGIKAVYDINGSKSPNQLSNCDSTLSGAKSDKSYKDAADLVTVCDKTKRVIKDQFGIRLRGSYATPNGAASAWAMSQ